MENRFKKLPRGIRHSFWSILDAALYPAVYLATVPILLHSLGYAAFGAWLVFNAIITILQLFNVNSGVASMGVAAIRNVSLALANGDNERAKNIINTTIHFTALLLIVVTGIGICLSYFTAKYGWFGLKGLPGLNIAMCIFLSSVFAGLKFFDQVFQSIIKAFEHFMLASVLNMINRFGLLIINLLLAVNHYSLVQMLEGNIIFIVVYLLAQYCCVVKVAPFYKIGIKADRSLYKLLLGFSFFPWIQSLVVAVTFQSDRFWVSSYSGLKEVSGYGLVSTMFNHIHMIFTAMAVWMLPRIAAMTSRGEDPSKLYQVVRGYLLSFIIISLLLFYYIAPPLITLWVGKEVYNNIGGYINRFVAFEIVFAHTIMPFLYLNAAGKERVAVKATLLYCGGCYIFMLCGLWLFHSPMALITGMTVALCLTMPVINAVVQQSMYGEYSPRQVILEMLPMYLALALVYLQGNIWLNTAIIATVLILLWKFYLSGIINRKIWKQMPNM